MARTTKTATAKVVDDRKKNFLTEAEINKFFDAARKGRHGVRDHAMALMTFRHGLRVSELIGVRVKDVELNSSHLHVRRIKGSLSTNQPVAGDELRAIKAWLRVREERPDARSPYLFLSERGGPLTRQAIGLLFRAIGGRAGLADVNPHMLRHSTGFYLANKGYDTRLIQDYLGHKNISNTMIYTRTAASRFEGLWR